MKLMIIDLVLIAILVICAWSGYKKGIIMGIGGLLVLIISLYGGDLLSTTFSYEVIPALKPFVSGYLEAKIPDNLYSELGYEPDDNGDYVVEFSVHDLFEEYPELRVPAAEETFRQLGIYREEARQMAEDAVKYMDENDAEFTDSVITVACRRVTYFVGFLIGFALIAIVLTVIGNLLNLSFKFPFLNILNDIGGLALGVITGACFCALLVWSLRFFGKIVPEDTLSGTKVAAWFLEKDYFTEYFAKTVSFFS